MSIVALEYFKERSKVGVLLWLWKILKTVPRQGFYSGSGIFQ